MIEAHAERIIEISRSLAAMPELGFREHRTSAYVGDTLEDLGFATRRGLARTGVRARLDTDRPGPNIAIIGEMDALAVPDSPIADPRTSAAHVCGHNAQPASMIGAALGLREVLEELCGAVTLFAVPAEECIDLQWRLDQRHLGAIEFLTGKAELIRLGLFDDVDMAMLTHASSDAAFPLSVGGTNNAAVLKIVKFVGRSAHAGSAPWLGVNALKAATLSLTMLDGLRETFRDDETVRLHPIVNSVKPSSVSAVPAVVNLELLVRCRSLTYLRDLSNRVDRVMQAAAFAVGTDLELVSSLAYMPQVQDAGLVEVVAANAQEVLGEPSSAGLVSARHRTGSTDMGDLGMIMPVVHPYATGAVGSMHGPDFEVTDHYAAAVVPAVFMAISVIDLLWDNAAQARRVLAARTDLLDKDEYLRRRREFDYALRESYLADGPSGSLHATNGW